MAEYQALNPNQEVITTTWYFNGTEIKLPFSVGKIKGVNYNILAGTINGVEVYIYKAVDINREILDIVFMNPSEVNITFEVSCSCILTSIMTVHKVIYHILNFGKYILSLNICYIFIKLMLAFSSHDNLSNTFRFPLKAKVTVHLVKSKYFKYPQLQLHPLLHLKCHPQQQLIQHHPQCHPQQLLIQQHPQCHPQQQLIQQHPQCHPQQQLKQQHPQ